MHDTVAMSMPDHSDEKKPKTISPKDKPVEILHPLDEYRRRYGALPGTIPYAFLSEAERTELNNMLSDALKKGEYIKREDLEKFSFEETDALS